MTRGLLKFATFTALITACGSEYQPYTSAPEPTTPPLEALLVRAGPNSTGTGTVAGSGIDCAFSGATLANTCTTSVSRGKAVTLTAGATGGSTFLAWGDACAASGANATCTVTLSEALAVSASFAAPPPPPPTYVVTVRAGTGGTGSGVISGAGINCTITSASQSGDCSETLVQGTQLTLTSTPSGGGSFRGWTGACASAGVGSTCTITVNQAVNVDASFAAPVAPPPPNYTVTIQAGAGSGGTGTITGPGITCSISGTTRSNDCSEPLAAGTQITLTAAATGGSSFAGWGGACAAAGTGATCTMTVTQNATVDASFSPPPRYLLTVAAGSSGSGTGTVSATGITCTVSAASQSGDCSESLLPGTQVTLTSAATGGSTFAGWGGACSQAGTAATCTITVSQATTVSASFTAAPPPSVAGFWSGTDVGGNIHFHVTFAQSGATMSLPSPCAAGDCRLTALSSAGSGWLGASYKDAVSLTGTVSTTSVTFTMNLGDRTVTFDGALTSPTRMVGQISGPTMPPQSLTIDKP